MDRKSAIEPKPVEEKEEKTTAREEQKDKRKKKTKTSGYKQKRQDAFREKVNSARKDEHVAELSEKLKTEQGAPTHLKCIMDIKLQQTLKRVTPLSITTRGVGFVTATIFDAFVSFFSTCPVEDVTVFSLYRVLLNMIQYKVYLTKTGENFTTIENPFLEVRVSERVQQALRMIDTIPALFATLLDSVGYVCTSQEEYVTGFLKPPKTSVDLIQYRAAVITPANLQQLVQDLSSQSAEHLDLQIAFQERNSLPGAHYNLNGRMTNPHDFWPENYDEDALLTEIAAVHRLFSKVVPKWSSPNFVNTKWSSIAVQTALASCELSTTKITTTSTSVFRSTTRATTSRRGNFECTESYQRSILTSAPGLFWSEFKLTPAQQIFGAACLVGETIPGVETRRRPHSGYIWTADVHAIHATLGHLGKKALT